MAVKPIPERYHISPPEGYHTSPSLIVDPASEAMDFYATKEPDDMFWGDRFGRSASIR